MSRAELECASATSPSLHARLDALDPVAAVAMEPTNRRRVVRALEVSLGSGRPFCSFGPGLDGYPPTEVAQIGLRWPRPVLTERIERALRTQMIDAGFLDEVARARHETGRPVAHRVAGARLQGAARAPRRGDVASRRRRRLDRSPAPASSPCARSAGSVATRAIRWLDDRPIRRIRLESPCSSSPRETRLNAH